MTIGEKLRAARDSAGLTQEQTAQRVGVSRQTVSSWENDRSYPDIAGVLTLAKLYGLTLDELLLEDKKMIRHLEESTDLVKSRRTLSRRVLMAAYLVIWAVSLIVFWTLTGPTDGMGYSFLFLFFLIPVATLVVSFFVGRDEEWVSARWVMLLFFGVMYMLVPYATFTLKNARAFHKGLVPPRIEDMLPGLLLAAVGMAAGSLARRVAQRQPLFPLHLPRADGKISNSEERPPKGGQELHQ